VSRRWVGGVYSALYMLLGYIKETQCSRLPYLALPGAEVKARHLMVDAATRKSLELLASSSSGEKRGSLYGVLDRTVTAFGSRELRRRIGQPLVVKDDIERRLDAVAVFFAHWPLGKCNK
jgi:DNA mismatch repair protein MutS